MAKCLSRSETMGKPQQLSWKFINDISVENTMQDVHLQCTLGFIVLNHCLSITTSQEITHSGSTDPNYFTVPDFDPDLYC